MRESAGSIRHNCNIQGLYNSLQHGTFCHHRIAFNLKRFVVDFSKYALYVRAEINMIDLLTQPRLGNESSGCDPPLRSVQLAHDLLKSYRVIIDGFYIKSDDLTKRLAFE